MTDNSPKTWYITGTSRGFGRAWAEAALARGDRVAATARNLDSLDDLVATYGDAVLPLQLDITDRDASVAAINRAHDHFGRLDVVVHNAGYGHFGFVEEISEQEARSQIETNVFGALWTVQAAIPLLRGQGGGHLIAVSSMGGQVAYPNMGIYHASKWALEGLLESTAQEIAGFGIRTTIIEPGGYATDWSGSSASHSEPLPEYQPFRDAMAARQGGLTLPVAADSADAVLTLVDTDKPPLRLILNSIGYDAVVPTVEKRVQTWKDWEKVSRSADA